jgi:hypothetical protein
MNAVEIDSSLPRSAKPARPVRSRWWALAIAGSVAFWLANLVISLTPVAAAYRSAMSINYTLMLVEAAAGGLVVASVVALLLVRYPGRGSRTGPLTRALLLSGGAFLMLTVLVEVPAKLASGVAGPGGWLLVATAFNAVRVLALGVAIGLLARAAKTPREAKTQ